MRNLVAVLRGNHHAIHAHRAAVNIFDCDLGFSIGTEELQTVLLADFRKAAGQLMRKLDRHRHQLGRLIARETEHQALIARAAGIHSLAISGDCFLIEHMTPQVSASKPYFARV